MIYIWNAYGLYKYGIMQALYLLFKILSIKLNIGIRIPFTIFIDSFDLINCTCPDIQQKAQNKYFLIIPALS